MHQVVRDPTESVIISTAHTVLGGCSSCCSSWGSAVWFWLTWLLCPGLEVMRFMLLLHPTGISQHWSLLLQGMLGGSVTQHWRTCMRGWCAISKHGQTASGTQLRRVPSYGSSSCAEVT